MSVKGVSLIALRRSATCSASWNLPISMYERPSHRSIRCDEAVGVTLEEVAEDRRGLIVLTFSEESASAVERVLLRLRGRVVLLLRLKRRGRRDGGGEGGEQERGCERGCADSIPRNQNFILRGVGASLIELSETERSPVARPRKKLSLSRGG